MPTVDELLAAAPESAYEDVNDVIIIDPVTRRLIVPPTEVILGVESDEDAERKYFRCPQSIGAVMDISECEIHVHYENAIGERNYWVVDDLECSNGASIFSWKITDDVAMYPGTVQFSVCICKMQGDVVLREWNTTPATGKVLGGLKAE